MPVIAVDMTPAEYESASRNQSNHRGRRNRRGIDPADANGSRDARHRRAHENVIILADLARMKGGRNHSEISCCVKYTVFSFNVIFWFVGLSVLLLGAWALIEKNPYSEIGPRLTKFYLDPAWMLLIVGACIFVIGFSGCIGALRENTCFLSFVSECGGEIAAHTVQYAILLGILLLLQMTISILFFVAKEWAMNEVHRELDSMIVHYRDDPDLQSVIDWIQNWLRCCGMHGPDDWDMNIYFNKSSRAIGSPEAGGVPFSCCDIAPHQADMVGSSHYYETGCFPQLVEWFNTHVQYVGFAIIAITVLEILGICFAQNLRSDIFAQRSRWMHHL